MSRESTLEPMEGSVAEPISRVSMDRARRVLGDAGRSLLPSKSAAGRFVKFLLPNCCT